MHRNPKDSIQQLVACKIPSKFSKPQFLCKGTMYNGDDFLNITVIAFLTVTLVFTCTKDIQMATKCKER